ncbi:50S ribosomal protein L2 [Candidatus Gracilibacteria bacterium]|nr:50S ribosomal protein L2 [Candidatus Gracilibacteria bacterium]
MGIKVLKPNTNAQRNMSYLVREDLTASKPSVRSLVKTGKKVTGRNNGKISIRHRGGGTRPKYRMVDFKRTDKLGIPGKIAAIEYDPNRTVHIALVNYVDGEKRYILAWKGAAVGTSVVTDLNAKANDGNRMQLQNIPVGFQIYNVELQENKGGQIARSAGQSAKLLSVEGELAQVELRSGEIRLVRKTCFATIGTLGNEEHSLVKVGKAGRVRHKGRRPQVRGKVMNPIDHPHGGGEGSSPIGMKAPKTPWGALALGVKTRRKKNPTDKFVLRSRHRAKKK